MNKDYQLKQLRRILENPMQQSGLYLIDTDLSDGDIEIIIKGISEIKYIREPLIPSVMGSAFELFVIGLSHRCETDEINELRRFLMVASIQQRENIIYSLLIRMIGYLSSKHKTIIHLSGECDLTAVNHEDLIKFNEALFHYEKTVIIVCKKKNDESFCSDPLINYVTLKINTDFEQMAQIEEKFVPIDEEQSVPNRSVIQNGPNSLYVENLTGPIIIGSNSGNQGNLSIKNEAYFNDIADQIIKDIDRARVSIHVAIAWFTNQRIADKLVEKYKEGLDIKVVFFKDHTNAKFGVNIGRIPFKTICGTRGGTMHNKFCVIDNQKVITGSYNWSENAENKNDENAAVMYDYDCASDYSVEFRRLYESV